MNDSMVKPDTKLALMPNMHEIDYQIPGNGMQCVEIELKLN